MTRRRYVALDGQDRGPLGQRHDRRRPGGTAPGAAAATSRRFQLQAAITALHVQAADPASARSGPQIAALYGALAHFDPSPAVEVNRAAAVAFADQSAGGARPPRAAPRRSALADYQPLAATQAELRRRLGDVDGATAAYRRAIELTENRVERDELRRRLAAIGGPQEQWPDGRPIFPI